MKRIYNIITSLMLLAILGIVGTANLYAAAPTTQARNLTFSLITDDGAKISWLNGNGTGRLVVVFPNTTPVGDIDNAVSNGTIYTGNTAFGTMASQIGSTTGYAVYRGTNSTRNVTITGLDASTTYNVKVYEYLNDGGVDPEYLKSNGTNNPRTFTTDNAPVSPPTNLSTSEVSDNKFFIEYTNATNVDGYYLDVAEDNGAAGLGARLPDYDYVDIGKPDPVYFEVGGLDASTDYEFRMFSYKGIDVSVASEIGTVSTSADATPPTVTGVDRINNTTIKLYFNENIVETTAAETYYFVSFTKSDDESADTEVSTVVASGNELTITFTGDNLSTIKNGTNVTITSDVDPDIIEDAAGNDVISLSATLYDWTPPAVASINRTTPSGQYTNADEVTFTVTFDESVTGIDIEDFSLSGEAAEDALIGLPSASSGTSVTVTVTNIDYEGDLELEFTGNVYDVTGNLGNVDFNNGEVYTFDYTAPDTDLATITAVSIGAIGLSNGQRETLLDLGDDDTDNEYFNIANRTDGDLAYIRVNVPTPDPADPSIVNGKFKIQYSSNNGTNWITLEDTDDNDREFNIDNIDWTIDITIAASDNLGDFLLDNNDVNGDVYSFRVIYTDRAGNAHVNANTTSDETIIKDIVAPVLAGYVSTAESTTAGDEGKFFNNDGSVYYNSTTNGVEVKVKSTTEDATIEGQDIYVRPFSQANGAITVNNADYNVDADATTGFQTLNISPSDFEEDLNDYIPEFNEVLLFNASVTDVAGNASSNVAIGNGPENLGNEFNFYYDVSSNGTPSLSFAPTDGNYAKIGDDVDVTVTFFGNYPGTALITTGSSINGKSVTESTEFDVPMNTVGVVRYTVAEDDEFISDASEIPFTLIFRDQAGNLDIITDADDSDVMEIGTQDWNDFQPGIDATVPAYTAGSITLIPEDNSTNNTEGVFGDITGDDVINLATFHIYTTIDLATPTTNMNGGILRVYPSYDSESGYNGYFEYNVSDNDEFSIYPLLSNLTGAQDGEDDDAMVNDPDNDWDWNENANGDQTLFFRFKLVSVGGNVGDFFPAAGFSAGVVDVVRPEGTVNNRMNSLTGVFGDYNDFVNLNSQYTNFDVIGHNVTFNENVLVSVDNYLRVEGINGTAVEITAGDNPNGVTNSSLNLVISDIRGRFNTLGNLSNNDPDDEWIIFSHFAQGNGDVRMVLKADSLTNKAVFDAAGNGMLEDLDLTAINPVTIDNIAPEEVELTATANGGSTTGYYNASATQITLTGTMPIDPSLNGGSYDIQYKIGGGDWTTFEDYDDVAISALDLGNPINIILSETTLNEENIDIISDGASRILRMVMIDRASNSTPSSEEEITFDLTEPELFSILRESPEYQETNALSVTFKASFTEDVIGLTFSEFNDYTFGNLIADIDEMDGSLNNSAEAYIVVDVTGTGELTLNFDGNFSDLAGNSVTLEQNGDQTYIIDNVSPTITSIVRSGGADELTNATTISYTVNFSECIDDETITLDPADFTIGTSGTIASVTMTNCSTYVVICSTAVDTYLSTLEATGVITDNFGNALSVPTTGTTNESYSVDREAPTVVSVTPSVPTITDVQAVEDGFTVAVTFSEEMDNTVTPTFAFDPALLTTLTNGSGSWNIANTVYTMTYDVTDNNESIEDIDVTVTLGQDLASNVMDSDLNEGVFNIATNNAVVTSITTNIVGGNDELMSETDVAENNFTVTVVFDRTMSDAVAPTITFTPALLTTLTNGSGEWTTTTNTNDTYIMTYDIEDDNENETGVDIDVTAAEDLSGNPMTPTTNQGDNKFNIDMVAPFVTSIVRKDGEANPTNATSVKYIVNFNEPLAATNGFTFSTFEVSGDLTVGSISSTMLPDPITFLVSEYEITVNNIVGSGELRLDFTGYAEDRSENQVFDGEFLTGETFTIDQDVPDAPGITVITPDNGAENDDNISNDGTITITGTAETNSTVNIYNGANLIATTTAIGVGLDGDWTVTFDGDGDPDPAPLTGGQYEFTATATDAAGNESVESAGYEFTIDLTAPQVTSIVRASGSTNPTNGASVVYTVTFSESVSEIVAGDFDLTETGNAVGTIASVSAASGTSVDVTVNAIDGTGTLRLDFLGTVTDVAGNDGTADYTTGQTFTIDNSDPTIVVTTPSGCVNTTNAFDITVTTDANSDYANDATKYSGSIGGQALTINSVTAVSTTNKTLNVSLANAPGATGFYDLSITVTDDAGNTGTDLNNTVGVNQIKFSTGADPTAKLVASGADAEYPLFTPFANVSPLTTGAVCAVTGSDFVFKYIVSADEDDAETVVVKKGMTTLATPADYSVNTTTNTITLLNAAIADNDVITVELSGTFTCAPVITGGVTLTRNPLPAAATFTRTGTSGTVCYNDNSGVILTIDQAVTNKDAFSDYTYEISSNGGAYEDIPENARFVLSGTKNSVLTITNIGTDFQTCSTFTIRVTKTIAASGCIITSVSSAILVNAQLLAMNNSITTYDGNATPGRKNTVSTAYTITAPSQGTPTSYEWRVVNGSNTELSSSEVSLTKNPGTTSLTNNIQFLEIAYGTYYVQVRAINSCQTGVTAPWPDAGQGRPINITATQSSGMTVTSSGVEEITVEWTNGNYDGSILLSTQSSSGATNMNGTITTSSSFFVTEIAAKTVNSTWNDGDNDDGTSDANASNIIRYGGNAPAGSTLSTQLSLPDDNTTKYLYDQFDKSSGSKINVKVPVPGQQQKRVRYVFRVVDFEGGSNKAARTYKLDGTNVTGSALTQRKLGVDGETEIDGENTISAISPNPAKDFIAFDMNLVESTNVTITIYSMEGREVLRFADGQMFGAGTHNINIPLKDFISGAYGISISFGGEAIFETFMVTP